MFKLLRSFFKRLWKIVNVLRMVLVNLVVVFSILIFVITFKSFTPAPPPPLTEHVLHLRLDGELVEQRSFSDPLSEIVDELLGKEQARELDIHALIHAIDFAAQDKAIKGILLELGGMPSSSLSKLTSLGRALEAFKQQSNKPIIAVGDFYDQHQYYLASYADELVLNPAGAVLLRGLNYERLFFKDALDKLAISPYVFRVGSHKSFVEPYIRNNMSDEAREDVARWMGGIWQQMLSQMATNRQLESEALFPSADTVVARFTSSNGNAAAYAKDYGLVDHVLDRQQTQRFLNERFALSEAQHLDIQDYLYYVDSNNHPSSNKIALIVAQGPIVSGESQDKVIAADNVLAQLDEVLQDPHVQALVLRVDSPGGSAFASELIRKKLLEVQQADIPVVVSMGSVAASGGYWISANSNAIFASPSTITGSIGIFGMFANLEQSLAKLGVYSDGFATSPLAQLSPVSALPSQLQSLIQLNVENGYQQFISLVAQGRKLELTQVEALAQGRIWTGQEAHERGLVDQLGDLDDAINYAASLKGLSDWQLKTIRPQLAPSQVLLAELLQGHVFDTLKAQLEAYGLSPLSKLPNTLEHFNDPSGKYVYCALCAEF